MSAMSQVLKTEEGQSRSIKALWGNFGANGYSMYYLVICIIMFKVWMPFQMTFLQNTGVHQPIVKKQRDNFGDFISRE
jgi:hypothetical protein